MRAASCTLAVPMLRGHSRLIDRRWWRAGCSRLRTKWLAGRRAEHFLRCAGRENGAFRRRWFLRGGGARKKAAGKSNKCAWSRSERQPFCGGLALNDWRAGGRSKWPPRRNVPVCAHYVPTCLPLQVSVVRCKAAFKVAQRACALSPQLRSELLHAVYMLPANVSYLFYL